MINKLENLCREINMPEEIISDILNGRGVFGGLSVYLAAALRTRELYAQKGISDDIYIDTIKVFARFVREHKDSFGVYGFDRDFWIYRCLTLRLFRLGLLEFEMCRHSEGIEGYAAPNAPVLSVHIPSDAVITREALDASYSMAVSFFKEFFPEFEYSCIYCDTWLLAPALKGLLPETSKILMFGQDYKIISADEENDSFYEWVYKKKYDHLGELPQNTSLQRSIKKHLISGGKIGNALGVYTGG